jgi:hypothetical protein
MLYPQGKSLWHPQDRRLVSMRVMSKMYEAKAVSKVNLRINPEQRIPETIINYDITIY